MKRTLKRFVCVNIALYIEKLKNDAAEAGNTKTKYDYFSPRAGYALFKNFKAISEVYRDFLEYKDDLVNKFHEDYMSDDKSDLVHEEYEENGETKERDIRKVKPEYLDAYTEQGGKIDAAIKELLEEDVELDFRTIDLDKEMDIIPENVELTDVDFTILELFVAES